MSMMSEYEFINLADQYLMHELTAEQRAAFESYCAQHPEAASRLEQHRQFLAKLEKHARRATFKQKLQAKGATRRPASLVRQETPIVALWNKFRVNALIAAAVAIL